MLPLNGETYYSVANLASPSLKTKIRRGSQPLTRT